MHKRLGIGKETDPEAMSVSSLYQNNGYLMSQIEPAETIIGPDSIDIEVKVFEGKQFQINEVGITGNQRVDDEVIRRELRTFPGELYDRSLLMQTIRTLGSMGHFNPETIMPDIKPVSDRLVNVNWPLEEQASDQFNIAGGWGSGTFVGSVGITLNNLSVKNFFKKGAWRPYPMGQNQRLSVSAQTNGTYYKAFALSFTDPWLGGKKPNSFTISAHFSEQNNAYYVWQKSTQYFRTYGVAAGLGKRLNWPDPYFTLYGEASYERFSLKNWNTFGMTNGAANLLSLKLVFARNSVDQPIYPRRGSEFECFGAVHAPLFALGRQGLQETRTTGQQHEQHDRRQGQPGALPLGRVPQMAVQGTVVPGADEKLEPGADAARPRWVTWATTINTRFRHSSVSRSAATVCRGITYTVSTSSRCAVTKTAHSTPRATIRSATTNTRPSCATRSS